MKNKNVSILGGGIILIFLSLYLFTRPAMFSCWDFTTTGSIGETIGGITSPIISLIGAYLVYISFQEQIKANKIQSDALADEKKRQQMNIIYQMQIDQFDDIKLRLKELEFVVQIPPNRSPSGSISANSPLIYKGLNALNEYTKRLKKPIQYRDENFEMYGMFLSFQFMLMSIGDLINNIEEKVEDKTQKDYLLTNIRLFYNNFIKSFTTEIISCYSPNDPNIIQLVSINEVIDTKLNKPIYL